MKKIILFTGLFVFFLSSSFAYAAFDSADFNGKKELKIVRITPGGSDVMPGRQIAIQFNRPVVPLGRMERAHHEIPVEIVPELKGQWRWINTSTLAYQLGEAERMKPATRYEVVVKPGIKTGEGDTIAKPFRHLFITSRPRVSYSGFRTWTSPGTPEIRITFNQPVSRDSVEQHIFIGLGSAGGGRVAVKADAMPRDREKPLFINGRKPVEARRVWRVWPIKELSLDSPVELRVEPGLVSALGPEKGVTRKVVASFHTFPEFRFAGIQYYVHGQNEVRLLKPGNSNKKSFRADPMERVSLAFTSPVLFEEVKTKVEVIPDLAGGRKNYDPWEGYYGYSHLGRPHKKGRLYSVALPVNLKAWQEYRFKEGAARLKDEFGRPLANHVDLSFFTDHRKPGYTISNPYAVFEKEIDSDLPVVVTNLDKLHVNYKKLTARGKKEGLSVTRELPKVEDVAFRVPLGIREMLDNASGAVYGTLQATPPVDQYEGDRKFFAQVTPYQVHVKAGHFNTLVWVTDLKEGTPVAGAEVIVYKDSIKSLSHNKAVLARATTGEDGTALLPGTEKLDPGLEAFRWAWNDDEISRLFVRVVKDDDMALVPLDSRFAIDTYRVSGYSVSSRMNSRYGHMRAWGTTAQGIYRAGDKVEFKIYLRNQDNKTLVAPPLKGYSLTVTDPSGKIAFEMKDIQLNSFGAFHGEFKVSESATTGWYRFELKADFTEEVWHPVSVLVSDFTPSPFRVSGRLNGDLFRLEDEVEISTQARLHAGGPYADAPVRVTARIKERLFAPDTRATEGFVFTSRYRYGQTVNLVEKKTNLDEKGDLVNRFVIPENPVLFGRLEVESAVRDDRGKYVSSLVTAEYAGRDRFVGLKAESWIYEKGEPAAFRFIVVDEKGNPVEGITVAMKAEYLMTKASRVKGAGNAYLTRYIEEWVTEVEEKVTSLNEPGLFEFTPGNPGSYRITATIGDSRGREHTSQIETWVTGEGGVVWREPQSNSLQIIPERESYKIGETARFLVKNPFPGATALVTAERYGVIKQWVQPLESGTPVLEVPVGEELLPGFYLSVLVVSPRVELPPGNGSVDLGKPAFRMGYLPVKVNDPYKQIRVDIKSQRNVYKPGEQVRLKIKAEPVHGRGGEPVEIAVAVLDESVFDLLSRGRAHFDPYQGFNRLDTLDLQNYSLLTMLVGRQLFEKKGANAGGDGDGASINMRSDFKFVSYWNPSIVTDEKGEAAVAFKAPDNLTGWRVFVMAVTPSDRMGLGDMNFKVNRPTEIRPVMPNQVTGGDRFKAGFSVMNRTGKTRTLTATLGVKGPLAEGKGAEHREVVTLAPYKRKNLWLDVETKGVGELAFTATARDRSDGDGVVHKVPVKRRRPLETALNYGTTTSRKVTEQVSFPENMADDEGGVTITLSPTVIGNIEGAFRYMRDYPYACWEQKLTMAVTASHYLNLRGYLPETFVWDQAETLPQKTLDLASSYQAPDGGMAYYKPENSYVSPYLSAYTALAFAWLKNNGHAIPQGVEAPLHTYLEKLLKRDVFPDFYSKGMASTVRAVALAALAENGKIDLSDLERYRSHVPSMSLFGKALFMKAALRVKGAESMVFQVAEKILAHSNQTGGKFHFMEDLDGSYARILSTPIRANGMILSAFTELGERPEGKELVGDIPLRLVRAITATRGRAGHWENTQENIFCLNGLVDYSKVYETEKPSMKIKARVGKKTVGKARFREFTDPPVNLFRPVGKKDPGTQTPITIKRKGRGRLYYAAGLTYAPLGELDEPVNSGIEIQREISVEREGRWVLAKDPVEIQRGDLVRVDLFVSLPAPRNYVVVLDPVPGGLEPVNRDLKTASILDAEKSEAPFPEGSRGLALENWITYDAWRWSFYNRELKHDSVRFYSDYLEAGNYHLSYTAQAIAEGEFAMQPSRAEEMYDPDVFGQGLPGTLRVLKD